MKEVAKIKKETQIVIGFALETENIKENASKKLKEKNLDLIIANTPSFFGEGQSSKVLFISKKKEIEEFENITKEEVAEKIIKQFRTRF